VFSNLLNNAAKYMERGGVIRVGVRHDATHIETSIQDHGVGLRGDQLETIFEMFAQASDDPARSNGGLGIGLALVKGIIDLHHGSIRAESGGPGTGSTFHVKLPRAAAATGAASIDVHREIEARVASHERNGIDQAPSSPPRPLRILIVDDLHDAADSLAMMLEMIGHDARAVYSAAEGLEQAASFRPDVLISDLGLPGMSGYELAERMRERPETGEVLLVALSGYGQPTDRERSARAGFSRHLVKPVALATLQELLDTAPRRP
jgi:CheY-like chemotaxis protein